MTVRRIALAVIVALSLVVAAALATAPRYLSHSPAMPAVDADVDGWLAAREAQVHARTPLIANTEKRVLWHEPASRRKTEYAVVYLHGFSATRQEVAPVGEQIAARLGANLFETRLAGHGLKDAPLTNVAAEQWLDDGAEALAVGAKIGDRTVLIGTSTGATLALALAGHPGFSTVSDLVLLSPNLAPHDGSAEMLTWPGGPQLASVLVGSHHTWTPANETQARYWATTYPMSAAVEMMRLVERARDQLPMTIEQSVLVLLSPNDGVVNPERGRSAFAQITSPRSQLVDIEYSGDPKNHVLAGDILAPENNAQVVELVSTFVDGPRL